MKNLRLTYVLCKISGYNQYLWVAEALRKQGYQVSFIFLDNTTDTLKTILTDKGFICYQLAVESKKGIPLAIVKTIQIFRKEKTNIVHTHLVEASLVGLSAAKICGIKKRVHTRHHSDFHHKYHPKGVMLDNLINLLSTDIIAVSKSVMNIVETKEKFHTNKTKQIYHGIRLEEFDRVSSERIQRVKSTYVISGYPVIGMVSRYESGKGIEYGIAAFQKLIVEYPCARLVIANAFGSDATAIKSQLATLPPDSFIEIIHENDIAALYKCLDVLLHTPVDVTYEAFGQVYIEAMAASIPLVCTLSGVASEYIKNNRNAIVVDYKNAEEIYAGVKKYLSDATFTKNIVQEARENVVMFFDLNKVMSALNALYLL